MDLPLASTDEFLPLKLAVDLSLKLFSWRMLVSESNLFMGTTASL